jgi:hypothetical protein
MLLAIPYLLLVLARKRSPLLLHTLLSPLASRLGLRTLCVHLLLEMPLTGLLGLGLVDLMNSQFTEPEQGETSMMS